MQKFNFGILFKNKLLLSLILAVAVVAVLFYSTPALAFHAGNSPGVSYTPGQANLTVTVEIIKDHLEEILLSPDNITASLLYTTGFMTERISATNCTFSTLSYTNISGEGYGFDFYGYGYGFYDETLQIRSNHSGYNYYSGYDYGYGYGNASGTSIYCTFHFNSTYTLNKIVVGITTYVNGYNLLNSSTYSSATATSNLIFTQIIAFQQANGTVNGTTFTANATTTIAFTTQDGDTPMKVVMGNATVMTVPNNSFTPGIITIGVVPPANTPADLNTSRTMGPVLELGPSGATFSPAINISFNMSVVKNESGQTIAQLYALYTSGYLKIRKVNSSGTYDLSTTWVGGTGESCADCLLVTQVTSFSNFATYDSTPASSSSSTSSSSSNGGSSITPSSFAPANETGTDTETQTPAPTPAPTTGKPIAVLSAPSSITVGDSVVLTLTDLYGAPISGATIVVTDPFGNSLEYITDATGKAGFTATAEGTYTYSVNGMDLANPPSTVSAAKESAAPSPTQYEPQAPSSTTEEALSAGWGALFLVGAGLLVVAVLGGAAYLLLSKKGRKGL